MPLKLKIIFYFILIPYNVIYFILKNLLLALYLLLDKKTQNWIQLRNSQDWQKIQKQENQKLIWIHASSGEIEYAKAVIRELKLLNSHLQIVISYSSLSAPRLFKNIPSDQVNSYFALPWDSLLTTQKMIQHLKPDLVIFSRTDFWPNLIYLLHLNKIKTSVISANPQNTTWGLFLFKLLTQFMSYRSLVNNETVKKLNANNFSCTYHPDTRFDQAYFRLQSPNQFNFIKSKPTLALGSTWPQDEEMFYPIVSELLESYQLIWAPHDLNHIEQIKNKLTHIQTKNQPLEVILYSKYSQNPTELKSNQILLIDQIGYLADAYRFSDLAFVGGSFVKKVHSVMEPLLAENLVVLGPYFTNNPEAVEFQNKNLIRIAHNANDLLQFFKLNHPQTENFKLTQDKIKQELKLKLGGARLSALDILKLIS